MSTRIASQKFPRRSVLLCVPLAVAACGQSSERAPEPGSKPPIASSRTREAWNMVNAPARLEWNVERNFSRLPLKAQTKATPWSDTYWPSSRGGLGWRWQGGGSFGYPLLKKAELQSMSESEISKLSPAEKYDIYMGRYDYPLVKVERRRTKPSAESWEGLCHGWAPASVNFEEPQPVKATNPDGITIPFGSSDVKALLTFYHGEAFTPHPPRRYLGLRCDFDLSKKPQFGGTEQCRDTNAGSFHLLLSHYIATLDTPLVADIVRDKEVWNHPLFAFESEILSSHSPTPGAAPGTVKEVSVATRVRYVREGNPRWEPNIGTNFNLMETDLFRYRVELDADDNVIGGAWEGEKRPDFLWVQKTPQFTGYYTGLNELYSTSISQEGAPQ